LSISLALVLLAYSSIFLSSSSRRVNELFSGFLLPLPFG